ncbi:MAG: peptide chain release factor N(5)-glutamine methyltransferase [Candidatus Villigracilaceae bacterium]
MKTSSQTVSAVLQNLTKQLTRLSDTPALDAQVLLAHVTGKARTWLLAHPETVLTDPELASVKQAVSNLQRGMALPYVLGHWEFFGLDFVVTPDTLIPRPETELLVERALGWLQAAPHRRSLADVGTGCGCIAVSLAKHIPDLWIVATDLSFPALKVAKENACRHRVQKSIDLLQCDLLPPHSRFLATRNHFDLICANLPYIPSATLRRLPVYQREPSLALDGGADGLDLIRRLLRIAPDWLAPGGAIFLEIEASQGAAVLSLAYDIFNRAHISLEKDLAGSDRLVCIQTPENGSA